MPGRPHSERLKKQLIETRDELRKEVAGIRADEMNWAPGPDMKPYSSLLIEIATMERLSIDLLAGKPLMQWTEAEASVGWKGNEPSDAMKSLDAVRADTLAYLDAATEEQLETPVPVPAEWQQYLGAEIEPEELVRWIDKHEYYHLGQMISYRWIQGHNPYKTG